MQSFQEQCPVFSLSINYKHFNIYSLILDLNLTARYATYLSSHLFNCFHKQIVGIDIRLIDFRDGEKFSTKEKKRKMKNFFDKR